MCTQTVNNAVVWTDKLKTIHCSSEIQTYWAPCSSTFLVAFPEGGRER